MKFNVIINPDETNIAKYKIARAIYAETDAVSLRVVEALASMIQNISRLTNRTPLDIACDTTLFESQNPSSQRHDSLSVRADEPRFQMCLRVVQKMLNGNLDDYCAGATRFHRVDMMPDWATSRGYIADIDGLLFYLS